MENDFITMVHASLPTRKEYRYLLIDAKKIAYRNGMPVTVKVDDKPYTIYPPDCCKLTKDGKEYIQCRIVKK